MMSYDRSFPGLPDSVPRVRRFVSQTLSEFPGDVIEAAVLMVSELATNSILYAMTDFRIHLEIVDDRIRVEVTDSGPGSPVLRCPPATEPRGRGLQIVKELSDDWGINPATDDCGKTVWFLLTSSTDEADQLAEK